MNREGCDSSEMILTRSRRSHLFIYLFTRLILKIILCLSFAFF